MNSTLRNFENINPSYITIKNIIGDENCLNMAISYLKKTDENHSKIRIENYNEDEENH